MELNIEKRPDPPMSLEEEHRWIEYCRHIPVNSQINEVTSLRHLHNIV